MNGSPPNTMLISHARQNGSQKEKKRKKLIKQLTNSISRFANLGNERRVLPLRPIVKQQVPVHGLSTSTPMFREVQLQQECTKRPDREASNRLSDWQVGIRMISSVSGAMHGCLARNALGYFWSILNLEQDRTCVRKSSLRGETKKFSLKLSANHGTHSSSAFWCKRLLSCYLHARHAIEPRGTLDVKTTICISFFQK